MTGAQGSLSCYQHCVFNHHWMLSLALPFSSLWPSPLFKQECNHLSSCINPCFPFSLSVPHGPQHILVSLSSLPISQVVIPFFWSPWLLCHPCLILLFHCCSPREFAIHLRPLDHHHQQQQHSEQIFIIMSMLGPHSRPAVPDTWGVRPSELCFNQPPRGDSDTCSSLRLLVLEGNVNL